MTPKQKFRQPSLWVLAFVIAVFLLCLSLYAFRLSWLTKPEESVIRSSTSLKKFLNEHILTGKLYDKDFLKKNFILVNTAHDISLAGEKVKDGGADKLYSITNRTKLANLLKWIAANDSLYQMAVCDLQFLHPSQNIVEDSILNAAIKLLLQQQQPKIIFAGQFDEAKNDYYPSFFSDITNNRDMIGNTHYDANSGAFIEYALSTNKNTVKSLPLLLYEKFHDATTKDGRFFSLGSLQEPMGMLKIITPEKGTRRVWNNFAPEMLFDEHDIEDIPSFEESDGRNPDVSKIRLGTAVEDESTLPFLCSRNKHKIIFIGAFGNSHNDKHETVYGQVDGSVILLNIFHSLEKGKDRVSLFFLLFLFLVFFLLGVDIVFKDPLHEYFYNVVNILFLFFLPKLLFDGLGTISPGFKKASVDWVKWVKMQSHYFILVLVALICNICFNRVVNIIVVSIAVFFLHKFFGYLYGKRK